MSDRDLVWAGHPLLEEIHRLEQWKAEALVVLNGWERVWEATRTSAPLGVMKYLAVLDEIYRLRDFNQRLMNELAQHGWGDMRFGETEQDRNIVSLLEEGGYQFERGTTSSSEGSDRESGKREDPVGRSRDWEDTHGPCLLPRKRIDEL